MSFHLAFGCDEKFLKYLAVLITSILKNTDVKKSFAELHEASDLAPKIKLGGGGGDTRCEDEEGYVFHILITESAGLKKEREKLENCVKLLSKEQNYPAKIEWHILYFSLFENMHLPEYISHKSTFYRLFLASLISCDSVLYLDVDMAVLCDIRKLFILDLKNYLIAAPQSDGCMHESIQGRAKEARKKDLIFARSKKYFNAGFIFINLKKWREKKLEKRLLYLANSYAFTHADQDIINAAVGLNVLSLGAEWNFLMSYFLFEYWGVERGFSDEVEENEKSYWALSHQAMKEASQNIKIAHYTHGACKPWEKYWAWRIINDKPVNIPAYRLWWDYALKAPGYEGEFAKIKAKLKDEQLDLYAQLIREKKDLEDELFKIKKGLAYKIDERIIKKIRQRLRTWRAFFRS